MKGIHVLEDKVEIFREHVLYLCFIMMLDPCTRLII